MKPNLHTAANGHLTIDLNSLPESYWESLSQRLVSTYRFKRVGSVVIGAGEQIHQSFQRPEFTLAAGWDNWSGHYLLSDSTEGDDFLQKLFSQIST